MRDKDFITRYHLGDGMHLNVVRSSVGDMEDDPRVSEGAFITEDGTDGPSCVCEFSEEQLCALIELAQKDNEL